MRRSILFLAGFFFMLASAFAQKEDPIVMTINGQPILRSEFEYSYNKNNSEGVIDKKSVNEYVDLFINYKLKVMAAKDAKLDTTSAFNKEFATYRDQQIRPAMINNADVEKRALEIYREAQMRVNANGGLVKPCHILIGLRQTATSDQKKMAQQRADSIYNALIKGADFAGLAKKISDDKSSAVNGGELPWVEKGQTLKEFDEAIFSMKKGELSKPFLSAAGYHIVLLKDKQDFFPFDSLKNDIMRFINQRGIREQIINQKIDEKAKESGPDMTPAIVLAQKQKELEAQDPNLKYLIQEYHDGLLLFDMSNRVVWQKAQEDKQALERYFKKHKKQYKWEEPRFKGIAYYTKNKNDVELVKKVVKRIPFEQWDQKLYATFNNDSILRVKVEKGIFKAGDNTLVDKDIFKKAVQVNEIAGYPYTGIFGKKLKTPQDYQDVSAQVVADYQDVLEKEWVSQLRKQYTVVINRDILSTVNNH